MKFGGIFGTRGRSGGPRPGPSPESAGSRLRGLAKTPSPSRPSPSLATSDFLRFGLVLVAISAFAAADLRGQSESHSAPKPVAQHGPSQVSHPSPHSQPSGSGHPNLSAKTASQPHLGEWMRQNQGLSPQEQTKRLQQEPGFKQLPPQQQQQLTNRLQELNRMPPDQRQRTVERVENMERLPPQRQQEIRASAAKLGELPPERQAAVRDAMRGLLNVPPGLRQSELNSPKYSQMSPEERGIAGNLLSIEPYHPPPPPPR